MHTAREAADFSTVVVDFLEVSAGDPCEVLLRVADRLCAELGCVGTGEDVPGAESPYSRDRGMVGEASAADELLVKEVRRRLAQIAATAGPEQALDAAVAAALNGSEMVMRGELAQGSRDRLPSLLPSFILLITLPVVDQDEALALSERASELVAAALNA
jgi:hypothetical protein